MVNEPINASIKNRLPLWDLHRMLQSVVFPESLPRKSRFNITESDRKFLLQYMSQYPPESRFPTYDSVVADAEVKFLLLGGDKSIKAPKNIRIFSKSGQAYGYLLDSTYIIDFENKVEFLLTAMIYANEDEVLNDDQYDYETVGYSVMRDLGEMMLDLERKREKKYLPNLNEFVFDYNKP